VRYRKEVLARERKARSPWSPASIASNALSLKFGLSSVCIKLLRAIYLYLSRRESEESLDRALERIQLELKLKLNKDWATYSKTQNPDYLRLEKEFVDCGGLLGPSDFVEGADDEDGTDAVEDGPIQKGSDESARVNANGGHDNESSADVNMTISS
jgi:hypothetical protein